MLGRVALSIVLSLLIHIAVALFLLWGGSTMMKRPVGSSFAGKERQRVLRITKAKVEEKAEEQLPFAKTDPDREEKTPARADFVGARNSSQSASEFAPQRHSEDPLPTQNGEESEEVVTFSQHAQDGPLEENQASRRATVPPPSAPVVASVPAEQPEVPQKMQAEQKAKDDTPADSGTPALRLPIEREKGQENLAIRDAAREHGDGTDAGSAPIRIKPAVVVPSRPSPAGPPVYDPTLADNTQYLGQGFRTRERLTRSTGSFVLGSRPALNVASTPRGRYEEEIYRRIAYFWYRACDEHRGDIIPGSVVVSLRVNSGGLLENMELVRRRGASVIQQSFTFGAIRNAALPPMPSQVRREMHGDLLELIFTFNFD